MQLKCFVGTTRMHRLETDARMHKAPDANCTDRPLLIADGIHAIQATGVMHI